MTMSPRFLLRPGLRIPLLAGLAAASGAALIGGPAAAQPYGGYGYGAPYMYNTPTPYPYYGGPPQPAPYRAARPLRPGAIVDQLEDQGYEDIGRPRPYGGTYVVDATAPGGGRVRLSVDAVRGVILNRVALADPRLRGDEEDDDEDRPPAVRYGAQPVFPSPYGAPGASRDGLPAPVPQGREAARTPVAPPPSEGALPNPADPRLAPGPTEGRPVRREATRSESPAVRPFGSNPGGTAPPAARKPSQQQARVPAAPALPGAPGAATPGSTKPVPAEKPVAEARPGPNKPVRVIPGVTPMNGGGKGDGKGEAQLEKLPGSPGAETPAGATP